MKSMVESLCFINHFQSTWPHNIITRWSS